MDREKAIDKTIKFSELAYEAALIIENSFEEYNELMSLNREGFKAEAFDAVYEMLKVLKDIKESDYDDYKP